MLSVTFEYNLRGLPIQVLAACRDVIGDEYIKGLTLTFLDENDLRLHIPYDKDLFEDVEAEAVYLLSENYFNPSLDFSQRH